MASISIQDVAKTFDRKNVVLKKVNLKIENGEFIVLLGPSGCGKSTLLRIIAGLDQPTEGVISIGDRVVNDVEPADRNIAMVFQEYALYPHMKVRENLSFGLKVRKTPANEIETRVREAAELLELTPLLDRKPSQLSGGQRQRVAIGRCIVRKPEVFLFDEPLSNLDAQLRSQTRLELSALQRRMKTTSVYVTHDQVEAMTLADRIVLLNRGVIQQVGRPLELYNQPANRFVATFIGSPSMNLVEGKLLTESGKSIAELGNQAHSRCWMGIRPESLEAAQESDPQAAYLSGRLEAVELLGHEALTVVDVNGTRLTAKSPDASWAAGLRVGERLKLRWKWEDAHWFDDSPEGKRIRATPVAT
jgi:sn-glycerol 3-phosphate transport system ATP-binding protein